MFNRGRDISLVSVLNWRDVMDNLIRFVRGVNTIDRHAVKKESLTRSKLDTKVALSMEGLYQTDRKFNIQATSHWTGGAWDDDELSRYKIWRGIVDLEDHETGTYAIQYRIQFSNAQLPDFGVVHYAAFLSVDGIRQRGPFGGDDYLACSMPTSHGHATVSEGMLGVSLSGFSFCELLPGKHTIDVDFFNGNNSDLYFEYADVSITRFNW